MYYCSKLISAFAIAFLGLPYAIALVLEKKSSGLFCNPFFLLLSFLLTIVVSLSDPLLQWQVFFGEVELTLQFS